MKLTWYGHSAFRIEAGAAKILIDPFLSDNPSWDGHSAFTQGTIWHIDSSDRGAERWRQLAPRIIPALDGAMGPELCDGTSMNSVTPDRPALPPRCRWIGSPPILRQDDTDVRRVLLAAGDTDTVDTLGTSACRNDVYSNGRSESANDRHRQTRDGDGRGSCLIIVPSDVAVLVLGETGQGD